jgi:hypothetical protein
MAEGNRRWGRILLVLALVVIVLLIAADRIGVVVAQDQIAKQTRTQLTSENVTSSGNPTVSIAGFPFLTQVVAGHYDKINITIPKPASKGVQLESLHVVATGVNADTASVISGSGQVEADRVVGTADLDWSSVEQLIDLSSAQQYGIDPSTIKITSGGNGQISMSVPVTIAGISLTAQATGAISVSQNVLHAKITKVAAPDSALPSLITNQLSSLVSRLSFDVRIPQLPYNMVIDSVTTTADGVAISASADHVVLAS